MEYQNQTNQMASNIAYQSYDNTNDAPASNISHNDLETPSILIQHGYQYIELLGEGSNGKTYRARNLKTGEIVAIKALKFSDNLKNYELFEREAKALQTIKVNGVPRYYDYISQGDKFTECWLVQEYIQGDSLLELLEKGTRFDELEILLIMRELTRIVHDLQTLYAPPIIHRDIKPSNILIQGNQKEKIKVNLIDFGAVANPQKRSGGSTVAGTVGYMAPEQLVGDCTLQSDYYSIGATALHLFTEYPPSDLPSDGFELHYEALLKSIVPDIHPKTLTLLKKLLAPQAQDRPKDSNELHQLINDALMGLYKSGNRSRRRQMRLNRVAGTLGDLFKYIFFFITVLMAIAAFGCAIVFVIGLFVGGVDPLVYLIITIVAAGLSVLLWKLSSRIENTANASLKAYYQAKGAKILSSNLDTEMKNKKHTRSQTTQTYVPGKVAAVFPDGIEFIFTLNNQTYTGYQPGHYRYKAGNSIYVEYHDRRWFGGGIKAWLVE